LLVAVLLFVVGIILAQWTQLPFSELAVEPSALIDLAKRKDAEDEAAVLGRVATTDAHLVAHLRATNMRRTIFLSWATIAQMPAVSVLTGAVIVTLDGGRILLAVRSKRAGLVKRGSSRGRPCRGSC